MELERKVESAKLFLIYQNLLTDKQKKYLSLYLLEDYSLGEIALNENVSRNAVFDQIKKTIITLNEFEKKLEISKKDIAREAIMEELEMNYSVELMIKLKNIK